MNSGPNRRTKAVMSNFSNVLCERGLSFVSKTNESAQINNFFPSFVRNIYGIVTQNGNEIR